MKRVIRLMDLDTEYTYHRILHAQYDHLMQFLCEKWDNQVFVVHLIVFFAYLGLDEEVHKLIRVWVPNKTDWVVEWDKR